MGKLIAVIKLPSFKIFKAGKRSKLCPYQKFHLWVSKKAGGTPKGKLINVCGSKLNPKDGKKLEKLVKQWAKKANPHWNNKRIKESVSWLNFEIGPSENKAVPKGYVCIVESIFE